MLSIRGRFLALEQHISGIQVSYKSHTHIKPYCPCVLNVVNSHYQPKCRITRIEESAILTVYDTLVVQVVEADTHLPYHLHHVVVVQPPVWGEEEAILQSCGKVPPLAMLMYEV